MKSGGIKYKTPGDFFKKKKVPVTFTRSGVAYDDYGVSVADGQPRYKSDGGVLVEEATTNLLTANQSTGTDTYGDTTGFGGKRGTETLSSTTEQAYQGNRSLKCVNPGSQLGEGWYDSGYQTIGGSQPFTFGGKVYGAVGLPITVIINQYTSAYAYIRGDTNSITGANSWQSLFISITTDSTCAKVKCGIYIQGTQIATFYSDMLQGENKAYSTSWTLGGTTRNNETLYAPGSVLNLSEFTIECEVFLSNKTGRDYAFILDKNIGTNIDRIAIYTDPENNLFVLSYDHTESATSVNGSVGTNGVWIKVAISASSTVLKLYKDGASLGIPIDSPPLPSVQSDLYFGVRESGIMNGNHYIRNVVVSKRQRSDSEIAQRAINGFVVDKDVTFIAPFTRDNKAYRVGKVN